MSAWSSIEQAQAYETGIDSQIASLDLPRPSQFQRLLDLYLQELVSRRIVQGPRPRLRSFRDDFSNVVIDQGHWIREDISPEALSFKDGARLGFILTLRETENGSRLVAASYNLALPRGCGLDFLRIHVDAKIPDNPVVKSRSHCHPGFQHVHLPFPVMEPRAVLDRIAREIVPKFSR